MGTFLRKNNMENKDTIQIANILLTRRCNLRCGYCSIVKDADDKPEQYPNINHYIKNELSVDEWKDRLLRLKANNPNVFLIFYGGEPFLYQGLPELIKFCHEQAMYYTIISNNTKLMQPRILDLVEKVGPIKGFTASIDPELSYCLNNKDVNTQFNNDSNSKTILGFENLKKLKAQGIAEDVVAEITVSNSNYIYLYDTLRILSDAGIYSSITTLDVKKSKYYDFSNITSYDDMVKPTKEVRDLFDKIINDKTLLVHIPQVLNDLFEILPCEMKCELNKRITNVTIDADGSLRLCLRVRGINAANMKFKDCIDVDGNVGMWFKDAIHNDYLNMCKGCNWTCMMFTEKYGDKDIVEHVKE